MHSDNLCARGVPKSVFSYASHLETYFQHEIICLYDKQSPFNDPAGIARFTDRFETYGYDHWSEVEDLIRAESVDLLYTQKMGANDGRISQQIPTSVHAVFQVHQPHGSVYAYISEWLSRTMPEDYPWVPYIVEMPTPDTDLRAALNIRHDALVFGRHGAYNQFDLKFASECIRDIAMAHSDIYFVFMNTMPFCEPLENVIHLPKSVDESMIAAFINTCDAMIHARAMGESFGLAVAEFLSQDKPVISYKGGTDKNHLYMMGDRGMWFTDYESLREQIINFNRLPDGTYRDCVREFSAHSVMQKFSEIFLNDFL